jgi:hypothetical protein
LKIPEQIQIGGITYDIKICDPESLELQSTTIGHIWYQKQLIAISECLKDDLKAQTLCHELIHAITMAMGYTEGDEVKLNEAFVDAFASYMHQIIAQLK